MEADESVLDAVREATEELGTVSDRADLVPLRAIHRTVAPHGSIDERADSFSERRRWIGEPATQEADTSADLRWSDLDALPDPVVPHELQVIEALRDGTLMPVVTHGLPT